MTMSKEAATSQRTRFLFQMVQNAIPEIFRRFSVKTIKLQYVIRFTLCMWIRMSWQGAPECMMQRQRCGAMWSICHVLLKMDLHRNCQRRHRISSIFVSRITLQVRRLQKNNCRCGLIMRIKSELSSYMMRRMRHTFQKKMCRTVSMNVMGRELAQSNFAVFQKMPDSQVSVLDLQSFQKSWNVEMWHCIHCGRDVMAQNTMGRRILFSEQERPCIQRLERCSWKSR